MSRIDIVKSGRQNGHSQGGELIKQGCFIYQDDKRNILQDAVKDTSRMED